MNISNILCAPAAVRGIKSKGKRNLMAESNLMFSNTCSSYNCRHTTRTIERRARKKTDPNEPETG